MYSEHIFGLRFDGSSHRLVLNLFDSTVCERESVTEVEKDGIELDDAEKQT